jgi:HEAT repeat protein
MARRSLTLSVALAAMLSTTLPAQSPVVAPEAGDLRNGWTMLASGDLNGAAGIAASAVRKYPGNLAVGSLFVQVEILRGGAAAGLTAYEQWLGARSTDAPYLLRGVALGLLREAVRVTPPREAQQRALQALIADGDQAALASLGEIANDSVVGVQALGALGNEAALRTLVTALKNSQGGDRTRAINALAATKSPLAVQPIIEVLSDPMPSNQIAAATALGRLEAREAMAPLKALMQDPQFTVRFAVAGALFRLHDGQGSSFLWDLYTSPHALIRAQALEATATEPTPAWLSGVRQLLTDPDPQVRLLAARLEAPHDPAAAAAAVQDLLRDGNIAVVEAATTALAEVATDFRSLRQLLRNGDLLIRVNAAARVLALTR